MWRQIDGARQPPLGEVDHPELMAALTGGLPALHAIPPDIGVAPRGVGDHLMRLDAQRHGAQPTTIADIVKGDAPFALLDQRERTPGRWRGLRPAPSHGQRGRDSQGGQTP